MNPSPPKQPKRALVIKLGHIGDVLVTTPAVHALKEAWPGLEITVLVNQGTEAMVQHNPDIKRVLELKRDHAGQLAELAFQAGLWRDLRSSRFDLCLEFSGGDRGAFLSRISGAGYRVGFAPKKPHIRTRCFHALVDRSGTSTHVVQTFLDQVRALGPEPMHSALKFYPGPEAEKKAQAILAKNGLDAGGYALVHPTSRWMFKCWTEEKMAAAMKHLAGHGLKLVLSAAPAQAEMRYVQKLKSHLDADLPLLDLSGKLDLKLLGALIARAGIFLGVDSAPMHMAAALGTPVVALFGPSGERMWGPWQVRHEVVAMDWDCRPCGRDGCEGSKISRCLTEMPPEMVFNALDRVLEG